MIEEYVRQWLADERAYTLAKFGLDTDEIHIISWNDDVDNEWWDTQFDNYLGRARLLGLQNANGRQALAKFVATAVGMLEACVREFGELPEPGVPSGENIRNLRSIT